MSKLSKILPTSIGGKLLAILLTIANITLIVLITILLTPEQSIESAATSEDAEYAEFVPNSKEAIYHNPDLSYDLVLRGVTQNIIDNGEKSTPNSTANSNTKGDYIFPESNTRHLTTDEILACTPDEIRLGRNEIYARHGRIFNDESLVKHFESTSWYVGKYTAEEMDEIGISVFNQYEIANLELMQSLE